MASGANCKKEPILFNDEFSLSDMEIMRIASVAHKRCFMIPFENAYSFLSHRQNSTKRWEKQQHHLLLINLFRFKIPLVCSKLMLMYASKCRDSNVKKNGVGWQSST